MIGDLIKIIIGVMAVFMALGIACAVTVSLRRKVQADPYLNPFGDMPRVPDRAARHIPSDRSAMSRTDAGSGRESVTSTAAARSLFYGGRDVVAR
jgi:hypothetical protein